MSPLAVRVGAGVLALLALIALRGRRWAYFAFVVLGLLYFPAQTHFRVHVPKCEHLLPTMHVLVLSLHNYAYIALFAGFYWMSWVQFRRSDARAVWALLATLLVGALVEIAEGMTGRGHCRLRDLVPDAAGALGAALLLAVWSRLRLPRFHRGGSHLCPPTFHRARALLRHRWTSLRRMRSRRGRRSLHVQRPLNAFRRSWDVPGRCYNAC